MLHPINLGGNRNIPSAIRYILNHFSRHRRTDVPKEFIFITSKTDISNPEILDRLFNSFTRNNVQMKFGIIGKPTDRFRDFLIKGRSPEHLVSIDNDKDSILKLFKLLKPAQNLPGKLFYFFV